MKSLKPLSLILIGSAVVSLLVLGITSWIFRDIKALAWQYLSLFIMTGAISFAVFSYLVRRFIEERLKILYRSIRRGKLGKKQGSNFRLTDDVISQAEEETARWTAERNIEISKLKEQEEFRREFLGNLAHELKTPVFAIQGYILTLLDGGLEDDSVNTMFLERASKATDRMTHILEDLDHITKLEVDDLKLDMRSFDIVELIQEVFDTLHLKAGEKSIALQMAKKYSPIFVYADRTKIAQVVTNLTDNSINYGNENGTTSVRIYVLDDIVTVEVSDNGPGIDEEQIPRLFERFYRIEKSRNRNEGGSGLGLAIVKHIVESHDQNINVRSTVGVGSTFAFTLNKGKSAPKQGITTRGLKM